MLGMRGERVLVTGAGGFLGRHLCRRLCAAGAEVHAVSRRAVSAHPDAHRWWAADLANDAESRSLVRTVKPHSVVHLGALTHAAPDVALVPQTFHSILSSTVNLLTALTEQGCRRVVLAGSIEEPYGNKVSPTPASPYAAAKWAAGAYGRMFQALYGTPVVIGRLALVYGPGQAERKVIPSAILSLLRGQPVRVSTGTRRWDFVFVDDAIEALSRLLDDGVAAGSTIEIGTGRAEPLRAVVEQLVQIIDPGVVPVFGAVADRPFTEGRAADAMATAASLGWQATTTLERGLERTVDWYRTHADSYNTQGMAA